VKKIFTAQIHAQIRIECKVTVTRATHRVVDPMRFLFYILGKSVESNPIIKHYQDCAADIRLNFLAYAYIFLRNLVVAHIRQSIRRSYYRSDCQLLSRPPIFFLPPPSPFVVRRRNLPSSFFTRAKSVARATRASFTPGRDYLRGKIQDCPDGRAEGDLENVLAWRHISVYATARRGGRRKWP